MTFCLLEAIDTLEPGQHAKGHTTISQDTDYFREHFPGFPLVPGVLLLESMAQLGGVLAQVTIRVESGRRVLPVLAKVQRASFGRPVRPGDRLEVHAQLRGVSDSAAETVASAYVGDVRVASATILFALLAPGSSQGALVGADVDAMLKFSDNLWRLHGPA